MKKKLLFIIVLLLITGCSMFGSTPDTTVKNFFNKYRNNDETVVSELNDYLNSEDMDEETLKEYKEVYLRQYSNIDYKIKDTKIDGDKATVEVEIKVYDYYKTNNETSDYFNDNKDKFLKEDGDIDINKYIEYRINKLLETTDQVTYTLNLNLVKTDDTWEIEPLTNEELEKIHGTYAY